MQVTSKDIIDAITSNMRHDDYPLKDILNVLEDGEALLYLGVEDGDQQAVEDAHSQISQWIESGHQYLELAEIAQTLGK